MHPLEACLVSSRSQFRARKSCRGFRSNLDAGCPRTLLSVDQTYELPNKPTAQIMVSQLLLYFWIDTKPFVFQPGSVRFHLMIFAFRYRTDHLLSSPLPLRSTYCNDVDDSMKRQTPLRHVNINSSNDNTTRGTNNKGNKATSVSALSG